MYFVDCMEKRKNLILEEKILQKLLGEVSETDLMGDPVAWRRIAFNVNQCFVKEKYDSSIFYGGEQCRCFFVKEVVIPVDSGSYAIQTYYNEDIYTDFCKNSSNKKLAQKAVANHNKSAENYDELLDMDGEIECNNGLLEKFHAISLISYTDFCKNSSNKKLAQKAVANHNKSAENYDELLDMDGEIECNNGLLEKFHAISLISIFCIIHIELALSMIMSLAMTVLTIYRTIFD
ncbi:uncharacterized protein ZBAI_09858 [Zygosaccharomyces bailii ISA1307]|nr:uncharacterized protein ZBAI_09858 [Zygosaccharomyces bailii ISA1307]